jgi:hypothetical protein
MLRRVAALTLVLMTGSASGVMASDSDKAPAQPAPTPIAAAVARAARNAEPSTNLWALSQTQKRPVALSALYGTYGALQALDVMSTRRALTAGAQERNPLMKNGHMGAMIAVKAAAGVSTIYFTEKLWKKNRVGAVIVMAALNGASAAIVAHNQRNTRR